LRTTGDDRGGTAAKGSPRALGAAVIEFSGIGWMYRRCIFAQSIIACPGISLRSVQTRQKPTLAPFQASGSLEQCLNSRLSPISIYHGRQGLNLATSAIRRCVSTGDHAIDAQRSNAQGEPSIHFCRRAVRHGE